MIENEQESLFSRATLPAPAPIDLDQKLYSLLKTRFQLDEFRRGQLDIIRSVSIGQDTLAVMPTGGGKSLCYQLPSLMKPGIVLVISPLIALMKDQVSSLKKLGVAAGALHSGQEDEEKRNVFREILTEPHYILYVSPERTQNPGFAQWIVKQKISLFAIDESHCMSQWGPDFRTDYHKLDLLRKLRPEVPILALTATATPPVLRDIEMRMGLRNPSKNIYGFYRPNLHLQITACEEDDKLPWIKEALKSQLGTGRALIYCGTRKQAHEISSLLKSEFKGVGYYHAGLSPETREKIQGDFESGKLKILAATNAFGMGIDRPDVRLVVHYQMPANIESYYQEIGRAGRDGQNSSCFLLYAKKDKGLHSFFIRTSKASDQDTKLRWRSLETFVQFIESDVCRFAGILTYFRDVTRLKQCGHCDVCAPQSVRQVPLPSRETLASSHPSLRKLSNKKSSRGKAKESLKKDSQSEMRAELLREWRKSYAEDNDIPAFIVFSNKTLDDLAARNPKTLIELAEVYGFGEKKVEHLGPLLLQVLKNL